MGTGFFFLTYFWQDINPIPIKGTGYTHPIGLSSFDSKMFHWAWVIGRRRDFFIKIMLKWQGWKVGALDKKLN